MATFYDALDDDMVAFCAAQHVFFVATAPREGRLNLSPKGRDTFRCLDTRTVAYLDLTGSGNETAAHLAEDPRVTLMMCSFDKKPQILRIYGHGRVVRPDDAAWTELAPHFELLPGARQIVVVDVGSVQTSCGYAVPRYDLVEPRDTLVKWARGKGDEGAYRAEKNQRSIDGKPIP